MHKSDQRGFTLIELLATLTIMAVIAAILFPFIMNYVQRAEHAIAIRSLRTLQDAMDRYRIAKYNIDDWQVGSGTRGATLTNYQQLSPANVGVIIQDLTDASSGDRTIHIPMNGLMNENVVIVSTDAEHDKTSWEVMRYRRATNVLGIDRKEQDVTNTNAFYTPTPEEIDAAFQQ